MQNIKQISEIEGNIEYTEHMIKKTMESLLGNPDSFSLKLKKFGFTMRLNALKNELKMAT